MAAGALLALAALAPGAAAGQGLAERVRAASSPELRLAFPARPEVCGAGDGIVVREPDGSTLFLSGRGDRDADRDWRVGDPPCPSGWVVARIRREAGVIRDVRLRVVEDAAPARAAGSPGAADLDAVSGQEAASWLLAEASSAPGRSADRLILAAALARDAVIWPRLLELARDRALPRGTRRSALHWLGRQAAAEAVEAVGGIVRDATEEDGIREAAVFALSLLPDERSVPLLIDVIHTVDDPRVRSRALFWLADSEDPRALALFEEILAGSGG